MQSVRGRSRIGGRFEEGNVVSGYAGHGVGRRCPGSGAVGDAGRQWQSSLRPDCCTGRGRQGTDKPVRGQRQHPEHSPGVQRQRGRRSRRSSPARLPLRLPCSISMLAPAEAQYSARCQPCGRASPHGWFVAHRARCRCPARSRWSTGPQDRPLNDRTRSKPGGSLRGPAFFVPALCPPGGLYSGGVVDILMSGDLA